MSKNILIISSSPRKGGNSNILCDEFMRGAREAGNHMEKIRISDQDISYCTGCCACISKPGACVQKDDMNDIFKQILAADVMVLATPVYFHAMNSQMKTFIDRTCPIYANINNKDVYFIISAAGGQMPVDRAVNSLRVFTNCLSGIKEKGVISITGVWDVGGVIGSQSMNQAYSMGKDA